MTKPNSLARLAAAYDSGGLVGMRNRIINGAMMIDQRNAGAAQTVTAGTAPYTLDRWMVYVAGANVTVQRVGSVGAYSMRITGAAGNTAVQPLQRIESNNIADLAGQSVTLSFTLSSSTLTSVSFYVQTPTATDNYTSTNAAVLIGTPTINSTATNYSYTFTLPSTATNGAQIYMAAGALTSGTVTLTNVQLEKGSTATSFDYRPYGTELALCQRYLPCYRCTGSGALQWLGSLFNEITTQSVLTVPFLVQARIAPTGVVVSSASAFVSYDGAGAQNPTSVTTSGASTSSAILSLGGLTGLTGGRGGIGGFKAAATVSDYVYFTGCEL